jgi:NAD(P)-dependent dehydrogenase (short-subunit alcohol dehydrogenase family)
MTVPNLSLENKVAVVTGSRRGLGKAFALAFAEAGADVAVWDKVIEGGELESVAREIQRFGRRSLAAQVDITRKAEVERLVQQVMDEFGYIDILMNDAAVIIRKPLVELEENEWDTVIDVDLKGYFLCSQAVAKRMVERKQGNIINMASSAAFKPNKNKGAYDIAKAGVVMLTRTLAVELAAYNIRVNAIAPGATKTKFNEEMWSNPEHYLQSVAKIPLGRWAETSDIIGSALFLASDASSYITGHTILVDGGIMA